MRKRNSSSRRLPPEMRSERSPTNSSRQFGGGGQRWAKAEGLRTLRVLASLLVRRVNIRLHEK